MCVEEWTAAATDSRARSRDLFAPADQDADNDAAAGLAPSPLDNDDIEDAATSSLPASPVVHHTPRVLRVFTKDTLFGDD